ncbi:glycosyltransferase family 4 protein [Candidatus Saganbacteria bacterium]|nr:glycosyltransferase family 4 protein [Candidatus Saganbacteria bacterium]
MSKILLLVDFPLSNNMSGPILRYYELSKALSKFHDVTLSGEYVEKDFTPPSAVKVLKIAAFKYINFILKASIPNPEFIEALNQYDFIITHGRILRAIGLSKIKTPLIIDLYGPWFIEDIASGKKIDHKQSMRGIKDLLLAGEYFICANEKQKDMYIGMMLMAGIADANLDDKVGIVPIGIPKDAPNQTKKAIKGIIPGISESDKVVLWWGGIWEWLDPLTPIKALKIISKTRSDIKLVFKGPSRSALKAIQLAKELGLFNKQIFFINELTPYSERANWLLESDIGIVSHQNNIETRYAWRTRALDYIWAGLPIITTDGDPISQLVKDNHLGKVVPANALQAYASAILSLLDNSEDYNKIKQNIKDFGPDLYWGNIIDSINKFCKKEYTS